MRAAEGFADTVGSGGPRHSPRLAVAGERGHARRSAAAAPAEPSPGAWRRGGGDRWLRTSRSWSQHQAEDAARASGRPPPHGTACQGEIVVVDAGSADGTLELLLHGSLGSWRRPRPRPAAGGSRGRPRGPAPGMVVTLDAVGPDFVAALGRAAAEARGQLSEPDARTSLRARAGWFALQLGPAGQHLKMCFSTARLRRKTWGSPMPPTFPGRGQGLPTRSPHCGSRIVVAAGGRRPGFAPPPLRGVYRQYRELGVVAGHRRVNRQKQAGHFHSLRGRRGVGGVLRARLAHSQRSSRRCGRYLALFTSPARRSLGWDAAAWSRRSGSPLTWPRWGFYKSLLGFPAGNQGIRPFPPILPEIVGFGLNGRLRSSVHRPTQPGASRAPTCEPRDRAPARRGRVSAGSAPVSAGPGSSRTRAT